MIMPALAVHVAVSDFFLGDDAHLGDGAGKIEGLPGKRVVSIHHHLSAFHET